MVEFMIMVICLGVFGLGLLAYALLLVDQETKRKGGKRDHK